MSSLNKCTFIGNLGKDPEIRAMQSGNEIASFSLGVSESWKDKNTGERKSKTEWVRVVVFNENLVRVVKNYLKKGSKVYIEGQMQTRKWTDQAGVEKYSTEIVLQNYGGTIIMLDGKQSSSDDHSPASAIVEEAKKQFPGAQMLDDEIPF